MKRAGSPAFFYVCFCRFIYLIFTCMNIFLDDQYCKKSLLPLSAVRHVSEFRAGILTVREKWELIIAGAEGSILNEYKPDAISIPANLIPNKENAEAIIAFYEKHDASELHDSFTYLQYPWNIYRLNDQFIREDFSLKIGRAHV